jgi:hypothetical protein
VLSRQLVDAELGPGVDMNGNGLICYHLKKDPKKDDFIDDHYNPPKKQE